MRIYLASSWRNQFYDHVLSELRRYHHEVYDFKEQEKAFHWRDIDPTYEYGKLVRGSELNTLLDNQLARDGFTADMNALQHCECCVLVLPCGRSAHLEAGYVCGAAKRLYVLALENSHSLYEPELMYRMASGIFTSTYDLLRRIK